MSTIDVSDIQGFALRGYNFPYARYLLLELLQSDGRAEFIGRPSPHNTGERGIRKARSPPST